MTDLVKEGLDIFTFKINGQKHTLQAPSKTERDGWFTAIEAKSEDAKAAHEGLVGSEGYKSQLEKFSKSVSIKFALARGHWATCILRNARKKCRETTLSQSGQSVHEDRLPTGGILEVAKSLEDKISCTSLKVSYV